MTSPKIDIERPTTLDEASARILDAILADARDHLVPKDAWLEPASDRAGEAEVDEERWLYVARVNGEPVGILDAQLGAPEPGVVTIVHVAVARPHRRHGVGRAMVEAVVEDATERACSVVRACVIDRQSEGFWPELDFERVGEEYRRGV